jgi:predicted Zn finger-like uncharacterized protein
VKFLCDRCKTRYSIGDERVRGKILKIRCKNCANVITVKEGMTADPPDGAARRTKQPTTVAPAATSSTSANGGGALGAAFVSAMTKPPPPALEEEWYVSIDGVQSGPFSLPDAQRWVASKPTTSELFCWSEGFDDWLPVDKVSQFRNARKKPLTTAPPPVPVRASRPRLEESPKPLFAATMASLEKSAQPAMPALDLGARAPGLAAKSQPVETRTNGSGPAGFASGGQLSLPDPEGPTIATPPVSDGVVDGPDDDLDIGEVSRVVNLADLARAAEAKRTGQVPSRITTTSPRIGGGTARQNALSPVGPALGGVVADPMANEGSAMTPVAVAVHRRGMIALLSVAGVLLVGVVVALIVFVGGGEDSSNITLGRAGEIDTTRPDYKVVVRVEGTNPVPESQKDPTMPRPRPRPSGSVAVKDPADSNGNSGLAELRADEVEAEAARMSMGPQRCYINAQKGAEGILIGDVKKVGVMLTVGKDGGVTKVGLSDYSGTAFGRCLVSTISRWRFRASSAGINAKLTMVFQGT